MTGMLNKDKIKMTLSDGKTRAVDAWKKHNAVITFLVCMILSACVYAVYLIVNDGASTANLFVGAQTNGDDIFMDFYNSVRDASNPAETYVGRKVIYPPMANLIFLIFSRMIRSEFTSTEFYNRKLWNIYPDAMFMHFVFLTIAVLLLYTVFTHKCGDLKTKHVLGAFAVLNVPIIFTVERSNVIIYALIGLALYAFFYDSESKRLRELSLLGLAFAFSIKIYPVVFGWLLIVDKRYKDAVRCAVYGVLMVLLPSLFFGGPGCLLQMFENMNVFSGMRQPPWLSVLVGESVALSISYTFIVIGGICFAVLPFFTKNQFKLFALGTAVIYLVPSLSIFYTWSFSLVPVYLAVSKKKFSENEWLYFIPSILPMIFITGFQSTDHRALASIGSYALILIAVIELIYLAVKLSIKKFKKAGVES